MGDLGMKTSNRVALLSSAMIAFNDVPAFSRNPQIVAKNPVLRNNGKPGAKSMRRAAHRATRKK